MAHLMELSCSSPTCQVRTCLVLTKDHHEGPETASWNCPACGQPVALHWRKTLGEFAKDELHQAINKVSTALLARETQSIIVPLSVAMLATLPESLVSVDSKETDPDTKK